MAGVIGVGIDTVEIARVGDMWARHGSHFIEHLLAEAELDAVEAITTEWLAGRVAVKEAVVKALGTGFNGFSFPSVLVYDLPSGAPQVTLAGQAREAAARLGVAEWHVSISHSRTDAVALAVASRGE